MADSDDWSPATWEGSRRRQHQEFQALPFRDKLAAIEDLAELARFFAQRREARGTARVPGAVAAPEQAPPDQTSG